MLNSEPLATVSLLSFNIRRTSMQLSRLQSLLLLLVVLTGPGHAFKCRHGECFELESMDKEELFGAQMRDLRGELILLRRQIREMRNSSIGVREDHLVLQHQLETCHLMVNTALRDTQLVKNLQNHMVTSLDGSMGRFEQLTRQLDEVRTKVQEHAKQIKALNHLIQIGSQTNIMELSSKPKLMAGFLEGVNSDCHDLWLEGTRISSRYTISLDGKSIDTFCDMTPNGGYILLQRRIDGSVDFKRNWEQYKFGFGNPFGDFWIGLEWMHRLTATDRYRLLIRLCDWQNNCRVARYSRFTVFSETDKYKLLVSGYSGTAGDALSHHHGMGFSTQDVDNDGSRNSCAKQYSSGWWFRSCIYSNLNGLYYKQGWYARIAKTIHPDGVVWSSYVHDTGNIGNSGSSYGTEFYSFRLSEMFLVRKN